MQLRAVARVVENAPVSPPQPTCPPLHAGPAVSNLGHGQQQSVPGRGRADEGCASAATQARLPEPSVQQCQAVGVALAASAQPPPELLDAQLHFWGPGPPALALWTGVPQCKSPSGLDLVCSEASWPRTIHYFFFWANVTCWLFPDACVSPSLSPCQMPLPPPGPTSASVTPPRTLAPYLISLCFLSRPGFSGDRRRLILECHWLASWPVAVPRQARGLGARRLLAALGAAFTGSAYVPTHAAATSSWPGLLPRGSWLDVHAAWTWRSLWVPV